jgi:hypothetical protein
MSMQVAKFVSTIAVHFPPPKFESAAQEEEWLQSIVNALQAYDSDMLRRAAQRIINTRGLRREDKWFPVPAEIRRVCASIAAEDNAKTIPLQFKSQDGAGWRTRDADKWIHSEMGERAAKEGWIGGLHMFIRRNGAMPDDRERKPQEVMVRGADDVLEIRTIMMTDVEYLKRSAKEAELAYDDCVRGGWPDARSLARLGESMRARNDELADKVLGGNRS